MFSSKNAEIGMGTLIIFIALVLVAAVAASVLVSTTESLQNKALETGKETNLELATGLDIVEIYAEDTNSNQMLEHFFVLVRLQAGSNPIDFEDLLLTFSLDNQSTDAIYSKSIDCANSSSIVDGGGFGVGYSLRGSDFTGFSLNEGDLFLLCLHSPGREVEEAEDLHFVFLTKFGMTTVVEARSANLVSHLREEIYP